MDGRPSCTDAGVVLGNALAYARHDRHPVTPDEKTRQLEVIAAENARRFCTEIPARFGVINPDRDDPSSS
jgi:hypothetical protein